MRDFVVHHHKQLLALGAVVVLACLLMGAVVVLRSPVVAEPAAALGPSNPGTPAITAPPTTAAPSVSPSAAASPTATGEAATAEAPAPAPATPPTPAPAAPQPTRVPVAEPVPPPPAPEPESLPDGQSCPYYEGENAPLAEVEEALNAAAGARFWTVSQVSVPASLVKAVGWQESGWQSAIIACDGGIGAMQVMPATADWMNNRFGTAHDVHTLAGNAMLGSALLQWSVKYFGDAYFGGDYTLRAEDCQQLPEVPDHREWCLLNAVISAYNFGYGAVDAQVDQGTTTYYPNHQYIENVRALMARY